MSMSGNKEQGFDNRRNINGKRPEESTIDRDEGSRLQKRRELSNEQNKGPDMDNNRKKKLARRRELYAQKKAASLLISEGKRNTRNRYERFSKKRRVASNFVSSSNVCLGDSACESTANATLDAVENGVVWFK